MDPRAFATPPRKDSHMVAELCSPGSDIGFGPAPGGPPTRTRTPRFTQGVVDECIQVSRRVWRHRLDWEEQLVDQLEQLVDQVDSVMLEMRERAIQRWLESFYELER